MKKTKLFALAFAALALGACSNDDIVDQQGGGAQWNAEGEGYVSLSIQLPSQSGSRANDDYEDGTPDEYDVKDGTLILFADGKINSAYDLKGIHFSNEEPVNNNITTTAKITQKINDFKTVKGLVVLNKNGLFTVNDETGDLQVDGASMVGKTLDEFNEAVNSTVTAGDSWHNNGFLMSNAVLATAPGGATQPTAATASTLVTIDASKIFTTAEEASRKPAANFYVERAESKVTLIADGTGKTTEGTKFDYTINGWMLDNTNNSSKVVRTVNGFDTWKTLASNATGVTDLYRFVGSKVVGKDINGTETYYRTYWGDDYNYADAPANSFTTIGGKTISTGETTGSNVNDDVLVTDLSGETPRYCFENTSDLANMLEKNMTRAVIKTTFNGGNDFFLLENDMNKMWQEADVKQEAAARLIKEPSFNAWAKQNLLDKNTTLTEADFNVTLTTAAGACTISDITLTEDGQKKFKPNVTLPLNVVATANGEITITRYVGGASYYSVWINHFGEKGTPWNEGETDAPGIGTDVSSIYHNSDANYLGRWGMLRNNWYEVNVNAIRGIGDPTVAEVTGETIDKKVPYISVTINILSWAKRVQNVTL